MGALWQALPNCVVLAPIELNKACPTMTTLLPRRPLRLLTPLAIGALLLTGGSDADGPTPAPDNGSEVAPETENGSDVTIVAVGGPVALRVDFVPEGPLVVPANGSLELTPDGTHIALGYANGPIEDDGLYKYFIFHLEDDSLMKFGATVD